MAEEKVTKKEYIVREGRFFGVDRKPAGTIVELTEEEGTAFADMVELRVKAGKKSGAGAEKSEPGEDTSPHDDTRDEAKNEENIGVKTEDVGTPRSPSAAKTTDTKKK